MQEIYETLQKNMLFQDIHMDEYETMIKCFHGTLKSYQKNETILFYHDSIDFIGIVIKGKALVYKEDIDGNQHLLTEIEPSNMFAEVFVCANVTTSPVHVIASEYTKILQLSFAHMMNPHTYSYPFHKQLMMNMMKLLAHKNLILNQKIEILSKRTIRERLIVYFDNIRHHANQFILPLNREALATYLCVDRSALSHELSKMMREGILKINRNHIELL